MGIKNSILVYVLKFYQLYSIHHTLHLVFRTDIHIEHHLRLLSNNHYCCNILPPVDLQVGT